MENTPVGIKDIAKKAGVSISTVSRVLNNVPTVGEIYRKRVLEAINELGYTPNLLARGLRGGKTNVIGVIVTNITNPFFLHVIEGIEDVLKIAEFSFILCSSNGSFKEETKLIRMLYSNRVNGLIITDSGRFNPALNIFLRSSTPVVFLDRFYDEVVGPSYIYVDDIAGFEKLIDYLYETGHRRFLFINGTQESWSAKLRTKIFIQSMKKYRIQNHDVFYTKFSAKAAYHITKEIFLGLGYTPDAVLCGNDVMAFGVIGALKDMDYRVPEDISVVGFDNISQSKYFIPALTTVDKPQYIMGKEAAELLIKTLNKEPIKNHVVRLKTRLIIRNSTRNRIV